MSRDRVEYRDSGRDRDRDRDRDSRDHDRGRDRGRDRDRRRSGSRDRRNDRHGETTSSLLVRNLSYDITTDEMRRLFEKYGDIRDVYIPMDYYTKKPRGFAFVEFYDFRDARAALYALDRYMYDGRELGIVFAKDKRKSSDEMRKLTNARGRSRDHDDRRDDRRYDDRHEDRHEDRERRGSKDYDNKRSPSPDSDRPHEGRSKEEDRGRSPSGSVDRSNGKRDSNDEDD